MTEKKFLNKRFVKELEFIWLQSSLLILCFLNALIGFYFGMLAYVILDNGSWNGFILMLGAFLTIILNIMLIVEIYVRNYLDKNKKRS